MIKREGYNLFMWFICFLFMLSLINMYIKYNELKLNHEVLKIEYSINEYKINILEEEVRILEICQNPYLCKGD